MNATVVILTKNEEAMIGRAIASVGGAFDVLVVDSGSTDATVAIAEAGGARVVARAFDDFSAQRNFALAEASADWVFFLDADERFTPELAASIAACDGAHDAYSVRRASVALGRRLQWHLGGAGDAPVRLLKRGAATWEGQVHERVVGAHSIGSLEGELLHLTHRTVSEVVRKIDHYSTFEAAAMIRDGATAPTAKDILGSFAPAMRALWRSGLKREGIEGAIETVLLAFNKTLVLAKVWEQTRAEPLAATYERLDGSDQDGRE